MLAAFMVPHPPMIIPEVGGEGALQIIKTTKAYERVADEIAALKPDTVIITSPHAVMYADYFHVSPKDGATGSMANFRAPQVRFDESYDTELVRVIESIAKKTDFPAGTMGERDSTLDHGTMVPLYFIRQKYSGFKLVRTGLSGLPLSDHYRFGQILEQAVSTCGRRSVLVASGDLSHKLQSYGPYGFAKEGPEYDERVMDVCSRAAFGELLDFDETFCDKAAECGHRSFVIMAGALDGVSVKAERLSHEDVTGVGYGVCTFYPQGTDDDRRFLTKYLSSQQEAVRRMRENEDEYVRLARLTIETCIREGKKPDIPKELPEDLLDKRAGAFVSIHKNGRLRGCVGTIMAVRDCLAEELIENAVSAATADPRFSSIKEDELPLLEISVDVLGEIEDISSPDELDVKKYGVIVSSGARRGLLLPSLDGVDSVEQQIDIARQKGGIAKGEELRLQRFEVVRHH